MAFTQICENLCVSVANIKEAISGYETAPFLYKA